MMIRYYLSIFVVLMMFGCQYQENKSSTQHTTKGDYSNYPPSTNSGIGGSITITDTEVTFTCAAGYVLPFPSEAPAYGAVLNKTCNRQGGCSIASSALFPDGKFISTIGTLATGMWMSIYNNNNDGRVAFTCIPEGQIQDWISK